jgi:hypothetical protein
MTQLEELQQEYPNADWREDVSHQSDGILIVEMIKSKNKDGKTSFFLMAKGISGDGFDIGTSSDTPSGALRKLSDAMEYLDNRFDSVELKRSVSYVNAKDPVFKDDPRFQVRP